MPTPEPIPDLLKAVNEASGKAFALWVAFLTVGTYLAIAIVTSTLVLATQPAEADEPQPGWKVSQDNGICVLTSSQGHIGWGLSESREGGSLFHYIEAGRTWPSGETVTLQVDNTTPLALPTMPMASTGQLLAPLALAPDSSVKNLLTELVAGEVFRVTTSIGVRTFSLSGAASALDAFGHCVRSLSAD